VAQALRDLESLLLTLYPPALEGQGLGPALEVFVQEYVQLAQVHVELDLEVFPERLPSNVEVGLFRIAQDALQAVCRRPMVGRVRLLLRRQNAMVTLTILDDGPGPLSGEPSEWGLARACWRAESLGGGCSMKVCPDCGSRFEVRVPLELEAVHHD
jgi:signal transduction histidine kinase